MKERYEVEGRAPRAEGPSSILILLDGTWNDETGKGGDGVVTNVVKLYRCLEQGAPRQVVRYFRGVGNDEDNHWLGIKYCGATGSDEERIRKSAYVEIAKAYHPGDHLFLFGFSRGAASARLLATMLQRLGIPRWIEVATDHKANKFTRHVESRFIDFVAGEKLCDVSISLLGVWDTVGAFGIPVSVLGIPFQRSTYSAT